MAGGISTIISFITKYSGAGAVAAVKGVTNVRNACGIAARGALTLASSLGSANSALGKTAHAALNLFTSVQQMGAIGGIMAGAQIAINVVCEKIVASYDKMLEAVERSSARIRDRLDKLNEVRMDGIKQALEEATTRAQAAAKAFDTMAAAYMKVEKAKVDTEKSGANARLSGLTLEKSRAMAAAKDDNERAMIGAAYDEKIAKAKLVSTTDEQSAAVAGAEDELTHAQRRAIRAKRTENAAKRAMDKAAAVYDEDVASGNDANVGKSKAARDAAAKAYQDAVNDRIAKKADAEVADEKLKQAKIAQTAALNDARREVVEAESAAKQLADAQLKAAKAELEREKAEQKAAEAARRKAAADEKRAALDEKRKSATSERDRWQGEFAAAFDLWRDPEAAASAVEADKKRGEDLKRFRKEVNRYGGKGKIDEYARLMREGDEEGMQERLTSWRKSSKFTPQVEQMVKAAAADQNKNAAERSLAQIEKNTADLAKKLDELLSLK